MTNHLTDTIEDFETKINDVANRSNYIAGTINGQLSCMKTMDDNMRPEVVGKCYEDLQKDFNTFSEDVNSLLTEMFVIVSSLATANDTLSKEIEDMEAAKLQEESKSSKTKKQ